MNIRITFLLSVLLCSLVMNVFAGRPNVILIMTDDQGYGDLECHSNPILKTPHTSTACYADSVRLTDFHVSPFLHADARCLDDRTVSRRAPAHTAPVPGAR